MSFRVTKDFTDLDKIMIREGTIVERVVKMGRIKMGTRSYYNLINGTTVVAVTAGMPPIEEIPVCVKNAIKPSSKSQ